ncbi:hypothetical protein [Arthrobacter caoxuetaonis]|uniref:Uncharacterized protein n=1 Tax=Arthrobacter caoxuetaonis TaxID=2886935 RepID=A0A9X1MFY9_9MICC|nr:hypothetical protein [Arthrobacter caoxuetaonis]MCC3299418.1 hypothetical protein [Arthrobacter caoxuetaonis]USQ59089.1 hypothetical protein NF551_18460 [Arthrobacter caoxuetaonis]
MNQSENSNEITAGQILKGLTDKGIDCLVYQTGGGTATIYAVMSRRIIIAGPGAYDFANPENSVFNTDDLYVGTTDDEDPGVTIPPGSTADQIVEAFFAANR